MQASYTRMQGMTKPRAWHKLYETEKGHVPPTPEIGLQVTSSKSSTRAVFFFFFTRRGIPYKLTVHCMHALQECNYIAIHYKIVNSW